MEPIPQEFILGGVYLPPLLVAAAFGVVAAFATARLLDRLRWSRWLFYPPVVFLAMAVIYTLSFGRLVIGI
ncbi:MAG: DUF1656 domain-containing protein [Gammaproteobacteria bacterium]